ncbi:MAG: hypothetical protein JJE10_08465 [Thermoleophilia bacterium]|nr:hypothetical protein [Thermoleophilia bacterium]
MKRLSRLVRSRAAEGALAGGVSLVLALITIRIWNADLSVPFEYYWDALFTLGHVKSPLEHGSANLNPDLGAPFSSQASEFPQVAPLEFLKFRLIGLFTDDAPLAMNIYWLASFPMASVSAWWAMRALGVSGPVAIVGGVLFSLLPYHFWRGESHLYLSAYWVIPMAGYLIARVLEGSSLGFTGAALRDDRGRRRTLFLTVLLCLLIATGPSYYAAYSAIILVAVSLVVLAGTGDFRSAAGGTLAAILIAVLLAAGLAETFAYRSEHGTNPEIPGRSLVENERYGLSLTQLVLPATNHRLEPLAELKARYLDETEIPSEDAQSLGLFGVIGLLFVLAAAGSAAISRRRWSTPLESRAGIAVIVTFLVATIGGASMLVALGLTEQFRSWNRLSVLIAFFALLGFCLLSDRLLGRILGLRHGRALALLAGLAVLATGLYDQTPARWPKQFDHLAIAAEFRQDAEFVAGIERMLPEGSAVFQLPYLEYPEGFPPPGRMTDYDPLRGYHHSHGLRWSYGAMKGRSADLSACLEGLGLGKKINAARAIGFDGLWLDSFGYEPDQAESVTSRAAFLTGSDPLISGDGRFHFYDLRGVEPGPGYRQRVSEAIPASGDELQDCSALVAAASRGPAN